MSGCEVKLAFWIGPGGLGAVATIGEVAGEVTADARGPEGDFSSGIAKERARAADMLASNSKSSKEPIRFANSRSVS